MPHIPWPHYWPLLVQMWSPGVEDKRQVPPPARLACTHHLGAEAAVGKLPHKGKLAGLRPAQKVPLDSLDGFQVVVQQPGDRQGPSALTLGHAAHAPGS